MTWEIHPATGRPKAFVMDGYSQALDHPGWNGNGKDQRREALSAKFAELPPSIRNGFRDVKPNENPLEKVELWLRQLRHNGWTLAEASEWARFFPHGLGIMGDFTDKIFKEIWNRLDERDAERERERTALDGLLRATSATALLNREFPPEVHLLGSLATPGSRMFVVGPTGVGKTMLLMGMAGGMITGQGFLNWRADRPSKVLFIDGEMPLRRLRERMELLQDQLQLPGLTNLHYVSWQKPTCSRCPLTTKTRRMTRSLHAGHLSTLQRAKPSS
jgi:AAA domain